MSSSSLDSEAPSVFYVGHHETRRRYVVTDYILQHAQEHDYDMLTSPITNDTFHSRVLTLLSGHLRTLEESSSISGGLAALSDISSPPSLSALSLDDTFMSPSDPVNQLILTTSPWIDLASPDPLIAEISRQVLMLEVTYASFCGASNVLIQGPHFRYGQAHTEGLSQYARAIQEALATSGFVQLQILLPMTQSASSGSRDDVGDLSNFARSQYLPQNDSKEQSKQDLFGSWDSWNLVRTMNRYSSRLSVALTIPRHLPPPAVRRRWFSEPLRILNIPGSSFYHNAQSETSLTQPQKQLISHYMRHRNPPWILLTDVGPLPGFKQTPRASAFVERFDSIPSIQEESTLPVDPTPAEASSHKTSPSAKKIGLSSHLNFIRHLQTKQPPKSPIERFGAGYQDYLQSPLQPLADNLESITYEVFEKDPVKYAWYENAIAEALMDWRRLQKPVSGTNGRVIVAVAGAGRGPLVTRALSASTTTGVEIEMWALEKNHNAFVLLQRQNVGLWNHKVNLVQSDMRSWKGPVALPKDAEPRTLGPYSALDFFEEESSQTFVHIDILVSELLGSFGDNELSPECLDGIQHLLNPTHGISIPCSYTAHLTPISAPKIHADILARTSSGDEEAPQIPYVVMLHAIDYLSTTVDTRSSPSKGKSTDSNSSTASASIGELAPIVLQTWEFSHPLPPKWLQQRTSGTMHNRNTYNERFAWLEFPCKYRGVCHGLAGYFETVLYACSEDTACDAGKSKSDDEKTDGKRAVPVELSTNPLTMDKKSKDMISWFPIYFPLKTPLYVPDDSLLAISMWRKTDGRGVWYEWMVEAFMLIGSPPQRIRLGASELHSSAKTACMM